MSPTERTLRLLRDAGLDPWKVERWIPQARKRVDLFGLFDYLALWQPGPLSPGFTVAVQSTGTSHSQHAHKMHEAEAMLHRCCRAQWIPILVSWRKTKPRGQRVKYRPRIELMIPPSSLDSPLGAHGQELVQLLAEVSA